MTVHKSWIHTCNKFIIFKNIPTSVFTDVVSANICNYIILLQLFGINNNNNNNNDNNNNNNNDRLFNLFEA